MRDGRRHVESGDRLRHALQLLIDAAKLQCAFFREMGEGIPMKLDTLTLSAVFVALLAGATGPSRAADADCMKYLANTAGQARQRVALYAGELKNLTDDPWATKSVSICTGALARAETYLKKQVAGDSVCGIGTSYVDSQVAQLFKSAATTCHVEFSEAFNRMSADDQRVVSQRVGSVEARLR
jgi:hypothetical protein